MVMGGDGEVSWLVSWWVVGWVGVLENKMVGRLLRCGIGMRLGGYTG